MKTYEIKLEPVKLPDKSIKEKYNIYYYDEEGVLESKEFHSNDGVNGNVRQGYVLKDTK